MEATTVWTEQITIKSSETDFQKRLKLSSFFEVMQDMASNHADHLGLGYYVLAQRDLAWVLSRKKVRIFESPRMGEVVTLKTWPKGIQQKIFFMRDHEMTGEDGRPLAASTSAYVVVNLRTRRIAMPGTLDVIPPDNGGLSAIDEALEKIAPVEPLAECFCLQAGYSAVDVMGHVNNARYIEWISDCFGMADYEQRRPAWLQINYLNEVVAGETVRLLRGQRAEVPNAWYITGIKEENGLKAFEAELGWEELV